MRDGLLLRAMKRVCLWQYVADLHIHRALGRLRGEKPWTLAGQCRRSAQCCEAPAIDAGRITWSLPIERRLFLAWQRRVNGFELAHVDADGRLFVFHCTHFDRTSRSCDSYDSRPGVCRDYPRNLMWQANPELHARCGYRALPPNVAGLRTAIDELDITPERREKLRRGLRLEG
jgi:Fe-S-cluster containining protein